MEIVLLDGETLGSDVDLSPIKKLGNLTMYGTTSLDETKERIKNSEVVITNKVVIDRDLMESAKNLRLICVSATGMNNIDLIAAKELGIEVKNVSGYSTPSVVQHTFTLLFYAMGHIRYYDDYVRSGKWSESPIFTNLDLPFFELEGRRWGIIGLGEIGKRVANIANAFGAEVSYFATSGIVREEQYESLPLESLLKESDIISIHAPLNDKTKNLLNTTNLPLIKKGAYLLNLGRGGIVNETALVDELKKGRFTALLDVLEKEPMEKGSVIEQNRDLPNLIITPHIAWSGVESRKRLIEGIVKNISTKPIKSPA